MNKKRRGHLRDALKMLNSVAAIVEIVYNGEEDALDNYPENLQSTERFERMEDSVDNLNDAMEKIDEAKECIQSAIQ